MFVFKFVVEVKEELVFVVMFVWEQMVKKVMLVKFVDKFKIVKVEKVIVIILVIKELVFKKRGRKKKDIEWDLFFYIVEKEFLFQIKVVVFWDWRDIFEFIF